MTPGARVAAAIEILDAIDTGLAAEQALSRWARGSRFAGSKDRAAVRDHVFDVLRRFNSAAALGGDTTGRARMIGVLRAQEIDPESLFTGDGHAPAILDPSETLMPSVPDEWSITHDLPAWLEDEFTASLGDKADETAHLLRLRAPVTLRVNTLKTTLPLAQKALAEDGIECAPIEMAATGLKITEGARRLRNSSAYLDGLVELQDAASQAVVAHLPNVARCLDYCAGGGGKSLALAASVGARVFAHDINPRRMQDLPKRADRAGVHIEQLDTDDLLAHAPFDMVFCDAPCSGSGAWRRSPEGKWTLTPDRLAQLHDIQVDILTSAAPLVAPSGWLIYATCSVLQCENEQSIARFVNENPDWRCVSQKRIDVCNDADGFFVAHLTRVRD